jgi:hypothetical protein
MVTHLLFRCANDARDGAEGYYGTSPFRNGAERPWDDLQPLCYPTTFKMSPVGFQRVLNTHRGVSQ